MESAFAPFLEGVATAGCAYLFIVAVAVGIAYGATRWIRPAISESRKNGEE